MFRTFALALAILMAGNTLLATPATHASNHGAATPAAMHGDDMHMTGTAAAFMVIQNNGSADDVLLGGETAVAKVVEVHEMADVNGVMEMRPLADGLTIPAGGEETLQPGGYHIMLIGLTGDLINDTTYDLTLHFENAGKVTVPVTVRPRAELAAEATPAAPITVGDITITGTWSRPAPAMGLDTMGTPVATPQA